jgi:hypothetical protein
MIDYVSWFFLGTHLDTSGEWYRYATRFNARSSVSAGTADGSQGWSLRTAYDVWFLIVSVVHLQLMIWYDMIWSFIMISPSLHDMSVVFMLLFGGGWNWLRRRVRPKLRAGLCDPRWGRGGIKKSRISAAKMIKMASYGSWLLKVCGSIGMKIWLGPRFSRSTTPGASWMGFWEIETDPIQGGTSDIFVSGEKIWVFFFRNFNGGLLGWHKPMGLR